MAALRTGTVSIRAAWALLFVLLLGLRLLSPPGFMPSFGHGAVVITICPDGGPASGPVRDHHGGHSKAVHQPCAYASAPSLGAPFGDAPLPARPLTVTLAPSATPLLSFAPRQRSHERPPLRGPPIPA